MEKAIRMGVDFLLGVDPATAAYPTGSAAETQPGLVEIRFSALLRH